MLQTVDNYRDSLGKVLYKATTCVVVLLSRVAIGLGISKSKEKSNPVCTDHEGKEILMSILSHAASGGIVGHLCQCLVVSGSSLMAGSSSFFPAAREACKALWVLTNALESLSHGDHSNSLPSIDSQRDFLDTRCHDQDPMDASDLAKMADMIKNVFMNSKAMQVALNFCLQQGVESSLRSAIEVVFS